MKFKTIEDVTHEILKLEKIKSRMIKLQYLDLPLDYEGPIPRPKCDCDSWGCFGCLDTHQEIRSSQGIYS